MLAIPWFFINEAGRHGLFGMLYASITAISLFWMFFSGTLIDRFDRKRIFMGINVAGAAGLLSLSAAGFIVGEVTIPIAVMAFATTFFIFNIHFPNLYAFAQEITERRHYSRIVSWLEIQHQLTSAIAGAIGALLLVGFKINQITIGGWEWTLNWYVAPWPLARIFLLDGSTYVLAFVLIGAIRYHSVAEKVIQRGPIRKRLKTGIDYLLQHPMLFLFGTVSYAVFISVLVSIYFLVPGYVQTHLGAEIDAFALMRFFYSGGCVLGGIFIANVFKRVSKVFAVILLGWLGTLFFFVSAFNTDLFVFFGLGLLLGLSNSGIRIMRASYIFDHIPNSIIGRVSSIFNIYHTVFRLAFILIFSLPFFELGDHEVYGLLVLGGFITVSLILLMIKYRDIRDA